MLSSTIRTRQPTYRPPWWSCPQVREAACNCIAELFDKIDKEAVRPHVSPLLRGLVLAFKDAAWPVRDAACGACGRYDLLHCTPTFLSCSELFSD